MGKWILPSELFTAPGMDHEITVRGEVKKGSQRGKPKIDRTERIRDWISDNNFVYTAIYQHVKQCDVCSAETILQAYLAKRMQKNQGKTAETLSEFAQKLERLKLPGTRSARRETVSEVICRTGRIGSLKAHWARLSLHQRITAMESVEPGKMNGATPEMLAYLEHGAWLKGAESEEELQRRVDVLIVHTS